MKRHLWIILWLGPIVATWNPAYARQTEKSYEYTTANTPFKKSLIEIEKKFGVVFNYEEKDLRSVKSVTANCKTSIFDQLLECVFTGQPVKCVLKNGFIHLVPQNSTKTGKPGDSLQFKEITGVVLDDNGKPVANATVSIEDVGVVTFTNETGGFRVLTSPQYKNMVITCRGYQDTTVALPCDPIQRIIMPLDYKALEVNYKTVKKQVSTESVGHIDGASLPQLRPRSLITNLAGVTPGLFVKVPNGSLGTAGSIQVRGGSRIFDGMLGSDYELNGPLVIMDNTPIPNILVNQFEYVGGNPNTIGAGRGGMSLLRVINADNIESVEVLKDADATAIYGARGANGVLIINTKKGKVGDPQLTLSGSAGIARSRKYFAYLSALQYKSMREQAFGFDSVKMTKENAIDLNWDTSANYDFQDMAIGGTASILQGTMAASGVTRQMNYRVAINYYKEGTILPDKLLKQDFYDQDIHIQGRMENKSQDGKLTIGVDGLYFSGKTNSLGNDFTRVKTFAPTAPKLTDDNGNLIWGLETRNPLSLGYNTYKSRIENVLCHFGATYQVNENLKIKPSFALNMLNNDETVIVPIKGLDPLTNVSPVGSSEFGSTFFKNTRFEFITEYSKQFDKLKMTALGGITLDRHTWKNDRLSATGFTSDLLLYDRDAAEEIEAHDDLSKYGYFGAWANAQFDYGKKYLLNLTLRRDGSSRFGLEKRYGVFWAVGSGYVLTRAKFIRLPQFITFAKIRGSYGITGNDQVGDYGYRNLYGVVNSNSYAGTTGTQPTHHANERFGWEGARKLELATDFSTSKWNVTVAWYKNISTRLLLSESLPSYTGFGTIIRNSNAKVKNTGWEINIQKKGFESNNWYWFMNFSLTVPKTKLVHFPSLETSNYASNLKLGHPLSVQLGYTATGVNTQTGNYGFIDRNNDAVLDEGDYSAVANFDPKLYGGLHNAIGFKKFLLDFSWEFVVQEGPNQAFLYMPIIFPADGFSNLPIEFLDYWKAPGSNARYQKPTTKAGSPAAAAWNLQRSSSAHAVNASFLRLKTIALSYLVDGLGGRRHSKWSTRLFASAENAWVLTPYKGADPGSQNFNGIAPLKRFTAGFQLNIK